MSWMRPSARSFTACTGVAIGHLGDLEAGLLLEAGEHEIEAAGDGRPVELAGIGLAVVDQLARRVLIVERGRHRDADDRCWSCARSARDRADRTAACRAVYGCVRERGGRRHQQHVVVLGADEGRDGDEPSPPGLFSTTTDWPQRADSLSRDQPRADVDAGAGAERQDELHRPLRPAGCALAAAERGQRQRRQRDGRAEPGSVMRMAFSMQRLGLQRAQCVASASSRSDAACKADRLRQQVALPQRAVLTLSLSLSRPTAPTTTSLPIT